MADEIYLNPPGTRVRAQFLAPRAVRITHAPAGSIEFPADRPWLREVLIADKVAPDSVGVIVDLAAGHVRIRARDSDFVWAEASSARLGQTRRRASIVLDIPAVAIRAGVDHTDEGIALAIAIQPGEGFYGWGEWFNAFRRERGQVRLEARDAIALIQQRATYSAIPIFLSSRGYAFWLLNSHASTWIIDPDRGVLTVEAAGPGADYVVIYGPAFRNILATYTALTGRPPLVPRWSLGLMATGYPQEPQAVIAERVREHRQRDIPLDAVILDYHWEERFHNFRWRRSLFPDPDGLIAGLRAQGVRLGLIFTPFVNRRNRPGQRHVLQALAHNLPAGHEHDDERALPEYEEARAQGFLAHPDATWWFGAGGMIDFSNPAAAGWWNGRLRALYDQGVAFFKNDDGEYLPPDGRSALGLDGREYHNLYGFFYGRAIYDGMLALDDRRAFIYARTVWAGSQRYPALFLGDQKPTFEHMRSTLRAGLNLGLLGFAHWTADVFGLDGKTTPELHCRYAQWALLAPIARYFWRPPALDNTRLPWSHGPDNEANFRTYAQLRYRLLPYYAGLGWEAHLTGMPIMRPMLLEFQDDRRLAAVDDQVMLGDKLLLAPVLQPVESGSGMANRRIVLPAGTVWHDYWSGETYAGGGQIDYPAPLDRLPILVRGSSVLPMGPPLSHIADEHRFIQLEFHCYPPYPAQAVLYDDDGRTRAYQRGGFSVTRISVSADPITDLVRVVVGASDGDFPEQVTERLVTLYLHRSRRPAGVQVVDPPGASGPQWSYDAARQAAAVSLVCAVKQTTQIEIVF